MKPRPPASARFFLPVLGLLSILAPRPAGAAELLVEVTGLRDASGSVRIAVCTPETFLEPSCAHVARVAADEPRMRFVDLPPGIYAVQVHHDADGDGAIDRTIFGRPTEGLGFSRDAPMRRGPPAFADAAVELREPGGALKIMMRYW